MAARRDGAEDERSGRRSLSRTLVLSEGRAAGSLRFVVGRQPAAPLLARCGGRCQRQGRRGGRGEHH